MSKQSFSHLSPSRGRERAGLGRRVFTFLFVISAGLNFYFLWNPEGSPSLKSEAVAAEAPPLKTVSLMQGAPPAHPVAPSAVTPVPVKVGPFERYTVQPGLYVFPEKVSGHELKTLHFKVEHSLNRTLCELLPAVECRRLAAYIGRVLMWSLDVNSQVQAGDTVALVYEPLRGGEDLRLLRLDYDSQFLRRRLVANYFEPWPEQPGAYFDPDGREIALRFQSAQAPLREYQEITSLPGDYRAGVLRGHAGTDFKAAMGTPVYAPFGGQVLRANWNRRLNGLCLELDHSRQGVLTLYLHLQDIQVKPGQTIKAGQLIAHTGNSGRSYAPHLHYEIRARNNRDKILNPFRTSHHRHFQRTVDRKGEYLKTVSTYASILQQNLS